MKKAFSLLLLSMLMAYSAAQTRNYIDGHVVGDEGSPLAGATVSINGGEFFALSGSDGYFRVHNPGYDSLRITVSFTGYEKHDELVVTRNNPVIYILMEPDRQKLKEVTITRDMAATIKMRETSSIELADRRFLARYRGGSLMTSLSNIPGVTSIGIGSGHSKPVIRGMGFNRVVVTENGIRHEAQQWGADHGLEIDQYAVDRIEVIKGPASVMYGSDAIGGVIRIYQDPVPAAHTLKGSVELTGMSNNNLAGGSVFLSGRGNNLFLSGRFTLVDYADYRIPADSVEIYSYRVPLDRRRMRNTAGNEMNFHLSGGYARPGFLARVFTSFVTSESGFFANVNGLEPRRVNMDLYDRSDREILFPSQNVNHFKITGLTRYESGVYRLETEMGYQNNFRQEKNHYISHGYMPATLPSTIDHPQNLEREFGKDIFSLNIRNFITAAERHNLSLGFNAEYQDNKTGGYAFIIPDFRQVSTGVYLYDRITTGRETSVHAGIRYDYGRVQSERMDDWFTTPVVNPDTGEQEDVFLTRAGAMDREFSSLSMSVGFIYNGDNINFKANAGKGFRMPSPQELAANGVNYHYFRYEKGNSNLEAEESWQLDMSAGYASGDLSFEMSPFFSYSPGYIYLDPTYSHDYLYGAGNQIFEYVQNKVVRYGGEVRLGYSLRHNLSAELAGDYIYSEQLSGNKKGFTIPFSPPPSVKLSILFSPSVNGTIRDPYAGFDFVYTHKQSRIVPPEKETPAYELINLSAGGTFELNRWKLDVNFRIQNLLNRKYMDHMSYYRLINAPEAGRNFVLSVRMPVPGN
jgi:iron complex outermembrane recepter protein